MFDGSGKQLTMDESTSSSYNFTPSVEGTYYCVVYACDDREIWTHVASEKVTAISNVTSVTVTLDKYAAYTDSTVTATISAVGKPILYCFRVYDNSSSKVYESFTTSPTFSFVPKTTGIFSVEAQAYDGIVWTAATPASLAVYEPFSYTKVYLSRLTAFVGDPISMSTDAKGGIPAIQYIYCVYLGSTQLVMYNTTAANYTYTFTQPGSYRIAIYAADATGNWIMHDVYWIQVQSTSVFDITGITVNKTTANVSDTLTYNVTTTGGATNYIYCIFRNGQQLTMDYSTSSTYNYTVPSAGTYSITVYATNGSVWVHRTCADVTNVTGSVLSIVSVTPASINVNLGSSIQFTTTVSGAVGTVKYIHCLFKGTQQLTMVNSTSKNYSYTPTEPGSYHLEEYATDDRGIWVKMSSVEVIVSDALALKMNITVSSTNLLVGDIVYVYPNASGGNGAYEYIYCLFRGSTQLTMDRGPSPYYGYQLNAAGTYRVDVYCTDATNKWIMKTSPTITVH